jgi:hypothetical protein
MQLDFRKASLPGDSSELRKIDLRIFASDAFDEDYWLGLDVYWILVKNEIAGCTAFSRHVDFQETFEKMKRTFLKKVASTWRPLDCFRNIVGRDWELV